MRLGFRDIGNMVRESVSFWLGLVDLLVLLPDVINMAFVVLRISYSILSLCLVPAILFLTASPRSSELGPGLPPVGSRPI
jgi:hypothetical protein